MSDAAPVVVKFRVLRERNWPSALVVPGRDMPEHHVLVLGVTKAAALLLSQRLLAVALNLPDDPNLIAPVLVDGGLIEEGDARNVLVATRAVKTKPKAGG